MLSHSHCYAVCIRPHLLRQVLRQKVTELATVISAEFSGCREREGYYEVVLTSPAGLQVITTKLLVGADGPFSKVREAAMLKCTIRPYRCSWANTILERNADDVTEGHVFFGRGVYLGMVPTQPNELVIFHLTSSRSVAEYQHQFRTIDVLRQRYTEMAPLLKHCARNIRSWDQVSCPPVVRVRAHRWVSDALALVGDAAVNVNPVTSQGASVALESGIRLATVVKRCFQRGDLSAHSLAPYEAWCRPAAEAVQELGDSSLRLFSSESCFIAYMKERCLRRVESNNSMKLKFMGGFCGLWWLVPGRIGWRDALAAAGFWPTTTHSSLSDRIPMPEVDP